MFRTGYRGNGLSGSDYQGIRLSGRSFLIYYLLFTIDESGLAGPYRHVNNWILDACKWFIVHGSWFPPYDGGSATLVNSN